MTLAASLGAAFCSRTSSRRSRSRYFSGGVTSSRPGRIRAGQVYGEPVSTLDLLPTAAAACGVPTTGTQPLDGVNLLPYLQQQVSGAPHEALFWKLAGYSAVRLGRWKLYLEQKKDIAKLFEFVARSCGGPKPVEDAIPDGAAL